MAMAVIGMLNGNQRDRRTERRVFRSRDCGEKVQPTNHYFDIGGVRLVATSMPVPLSCVDLEEWNNMRQSEGRRRVAVLSAGRERRDSALKRYGLKCGCAFDTLVVFEAAPPDGSRGCK